MLNTEVAVPRDERILVPVPEVPLFPAAITLRPHHFFAPSDVRDALSGRVDVQDLARKITGFIDVHGDGQQSDGQDDGYKRDVLGDTLRDKQRFQGGIERYFTSLRDLPDEAPILFDSSVDGVCQATCVGRHCTQYTGGRTGFDNFIMTLMLDFFRKSDYQLGKDWAEDQIEHVEFIIDLLATDDFENPVIISYPTIVVRAGIIRKEEESLLAEMHKSKGIIFIQGK